MDGLIVLVSLAIGLTGGAIWARWRYNVVRELRAIHKLLAETQEPELKRIRRLLEHGSNVARDMEEPPS